jgi:ParB-like chromosome segregation protein Spo0J
MHLRIDPELQAMIPLPAAEERTQLEANLRADGCRDPLVVWAGEPPARVCPSCPPGTAPSRATALIEAREESVVWLCGFCDHGELRPWILLDGHTRYAICRAHGIPFTVVEAPSWVRTFEDAKVWMIRNQLARRNLAPYQRAELALVLEPLISAKAKAHQQQAGGAVPQKLAEAVDTRETLAQVAQVSHETMRKAKVIAEEADEPTKEALRRGKRTIHGVYQELRHPRTAVNQTAVIEPSAVPTTSPAQGHGEAREETPHDDRVDGASPSVMARQLIELADSSLQVLATWRRRFPEDLSIHAFGLMERHLRDLQRYFETKLVDTGESGVSIEASAAGKSG